MSSYRHIGSIAVWLFVCMFASALYADEFANEDVGAVNEQAPGQGGAAGAGVEVGNGVVARSTFTSDIVEREPVDHLMSVSDDQVQVYYFTELHNLEGQSVVHRWEYEGQVMAEVPFAVGGPRWRVWSSKRLIQEWLGEWSVTVLDAAGVVLARDSFTYMEQSR